MFALKIKTEKKLSIYGACCDYHNILAFRSGYERIHYRRIENSCGGMFRGTSMVKWKLIYTKTAQRDSLKLQNSGLKNRALKILEILENDPFQNPPTYEKLVGDLKGAYSRRINIRHRIIYQVLKKEKIVKIIRMWSHYGD